MMASMVDPWPHRDRDAARRLRGAGRVVADRDVIVFVELHPGLDAHPRFSARQRCKTPWFLRSDKVGEVNGHDRRRIMSLRR